MSLRFPSMCLQSGYETTRKKKFSRLEATLDAGSVTSMRLDRPTGFAVAKQVQRERHRRKSTAPGSSRPARYESRWPVDVARLASRRRAHALIRACQHAQQHAFIFVHADLQPTCSMMMFIAEQRLIAGSKRNRRANTTRAVPPFPRLQNACRCPTCSTPCSCDCSPASSAICTGFWSRTTWQTGGSDESGGQYLQIRRRASSGAQVMAVRKLHVRVRR
jgi:hypothetical protein